MQETVNWSSELTLSREKVVMSEEYSKADSKQTDFGFGVDAQTEDPLRDLTRLAHQASPHDLVMGGISRAGSRQQSISYKMPSWMKHKMKSRLPGEISIT